MTTIVVGLRPGDRGESASHLAAMLARSTDSPLLVVAITPTPWPPSPFLGDEEYLELQQRAAQEALDRARSIIGDHLAAEFLVESARSVTDGLLQVSARAEAGLVVLGSAGSGLPGRVSLGSVAQRILHSLDTPVCFAPAHFSVPADARVSRITVGFGRADADSGLLTAALARAEAFGIPLRVACFAVRPSTAARGSIEMSAEDLVIGEWAEQARARIRYAASQAGVEPETVEVVVGSGSGWEEAIGALSWTPTDLLAIGAKTSAISRFLLGSHAAKIVKHAPVSVLTVARDSLPA
ncbi:MAG TPA: universal stress protein [Microlunatus sp.]|nr:universal stress protein [Microlunatus sp.]